MLSIALFQQLSSRQILSIVEITAIRTYSRKTNKQKNIYTIALGARSIAINKYSVGNFLQKMLRWIWSTEKHDLHGL